MIGIPDPHRGQRVKAYIVLKDGICPDETSKKQIMETLRLHVARYAIPKEIEFRSELPKTLVGKVAYRLLVEENTETARASA